MSMKMLICLKIIVKESKGNSSKDVDGQTKMGNQA